MKKHKKEVQQTDAAAGSGPKKRTGKKKIWIIGGIVVVVAFFVFKSCSGAGAKMQDPYLYAAAETRDMVSTLTGTATLQPADSYTVSTLVAGDILAAGFEEGDIVTKGNTLYEIDSSKRATGIEQAEIALSQTQRAYQKKAGSANDLTITAPISGMVQGITAQEGDSVGAQMAVATIENTDTLILTEYYSEEYIGQIYAGMGATVSIPEQMLNIEGRVKEVSSVKRTSDTGILCYAVTVEFINPGSVAVGSAATCWLNGGSSIYPSIVATEGVRASERAVIYPDVTGTISDIPIRNGERIKAGQTIMSLSSDTLHDEILNAQDSLRNSELSLKSQYDTLEDYTITAPIDGTIVNKYYKEGETSEAGKPLCIIYDLSNLVLTMNVDELDIAQVSVGQTAAITADAVTGKVYQGVITKIGINGTSTGGVTTYPVSIRIDETEGLLPGMNVDISVIVQQRQQTIAVPSDAVERSNRVLVKSADGTTGEGAPEGYQYVEVQTGISDTAFTEILSGIKAGDEIAYKPPQASGGMMFGMGPAVSVGAPAGGGR